MPNRQDFYPECRLGQDGNALSEEQFGEVWCKQCLNPECERSQHGKSLFDQRTISWEERLFTQVPRMSQDDPRYLSITRQAFHTIDVGPTPEVRTSAWHDPRDLGAAPAPTHFSAPVPMPAPVPPAPAPAPVVRELKPSGPVTSAQPAQAPIPPPAAPVRPALRPQQPVPMNTPSPQGRMLHGAPVPAPAPDPWSGPSKPAVPSSPGHDVVVAPGAKVRLGGGGT